MWVIVYILIIATTIVFVPSNVIDIIRIPKEMVFVFFGFLIIASSWIQKTNRRIVYKNLWAGLLLSYTVLGFCWFYYFPLVMSTGRMEFHIWAIRPFINTVLGLILIQTLVENTLTLKNWINVSKCLCWTAFAMSVFALLQFVGLDQVFGASQEFIAFVNNGFARKQLMMTFLGNEFLTANFLAIISPLCLMYKQKRYKFIYALILLTICLADNTTAFFSFFIGLFCYLILTKKIKMIVVSLLICVPLLIVMCNVHKQFFVDMGRFAVWKHVIKDVIETDIVYLGTGIGSFAAAKYKFGGLHAQQAHNEFVQFFKEGGLLLLIIFFGYFWSLIKRGYSYFKRNNSVLFTCYTCALISYVFTFINGFPLRIAPLAVVGILYISSLEAQIQGETYI